MLMVGLLIYSYTILVHNTYYNPDPPYTLLLPAYSLFDYSIFLCPLDPPNLL